MDYLKAGIEEVRSLLHAYDVKFRDIESIERFLVLELPHLRKYNEKTVEALRRILSRSATVKRGLLVYGEFRGDVTKEKISSDNIIEVLNKASTAAIHVHFFNSATINSSNIRIIIDRIYETLFKNYKGRIRLSNPETIIALYNISDYNWLGIEIYEEGGKGFEYRRSKYRPVFSPFSLHPKLSRLMINLARVKEGDIIIDPFCGVGSIPIESVLINIECICMELRYKWCTGCLKNIEWVKKDLNLVNIVNADSLSSILRMDKMDFSVVTDPPYGRITSTAGYEPRSIYETFVEKYVVNARTSVFMSPREIDDLLMNYDLIISFKDVIPVHSNLTRYLYVIVR
jgi:tRNA (guanine10-N2)-dimethyltransferase